MRPVVTLTLADLDAALETAASDGADGLYFASFSILAADPARIVDFAASKRLPAIYYDSQFVALGGLMSFGASIPAMARRAAAFVDKVLRGANPGDIPVEYTTSYDLVINLNTARALGITFPQSILVQATEVIQ